MVSEVIFHDELRLAKMVSSEAKLEAFNAEIFKILSADAFDSTIKIDGITLTIFKPYKFKKDNILKVEAKHGWSAYLGDQMVSSITYGSQYDTKEHLMVMLNDKFENGFGDHIRKSLGYFQKISNAA